jgi:hypothetical protein
VRWLLIIMVLAGCASIAKHETISLFCFGLCQFTDVNHESQKAEGPPKETKE